MPSDACVVNAVINMGKSLHMRIVAEGVEALDQLVFLKEHGCSEAQGYYFSRPLKAPDFAVWMSQRNSTNDTRALKSAGIKG